ncbi:sensor histidine kinase [Paenibacillus sacheonensis]|uniref:histidine kinase n=2 Tax=Paenibacillus sacheonensis TaxID=742054 RepID=A0A7X4YXF9_9BACL|nr:signal transduction histidine kinase [Paenibacillus sacheonensis]NBC73371.1 sensor histidine kinase [Paenibacillus sacheonensis]
MHTTADKEDAYGRRWSPVVWKWLFGLKFAFDLALTGIFYFEHSISFFWRLSFVLFSLAAFLFVGFVYFDWNKRQNWLFHLLIIDFLVSASYGYVYIGGDFPNHLFIGITALAIFMFVKKTRTLILTCLLLLVLYVVTMGGIDWYVYRDFDEVGYFTTGSFIVFAGIVSALVNFYRGARQHTMELYAELMASHAKLQEYALQTEEWGAAKERVRIARDIHDSAGHKLTALLVQMQAARKLSQVDAERSAQTYLACEQLIRDSLQEIRLSVRAIRDEPVKTASLGDRLEQLAREFSKWAEVQTTVEVDGTPVALPGELQLTAYRIAQESLTNAQKHGHARTAEIQLAYSERGFSLRIRNDGEVPAAFKPGFGIINLQERVREWNGEVQVGADRRRGFAVEVNFPYSVAEMER